MQISIMLKGPRQTGPDSGEVMSEAHEFIPGETVEQLVSRLLYDVVIDKEHSFPDPYYPDKRYMDKHPNKLAPHQWRSYSDIIEIRLIKEMGGF